MSGYLQRLFAWAGAADGPAATPSAPSLSPVARFDQRLTVPGIADSLLWNPGPLSDEAGESEDDISPDAPAAPRPRRAGPRSTRRAGSRNLPAAPDAAPSQPTPFDPGANPAPAPRQAVVRPADPPLPPVAHVGAVEQDDLEFAEPASPPVPEEARHSRAESDRHGEPPPAASEPPSPATAIEPTAPRRAEPAAAWPSTESHSEGPTDFPPPPAEAVPKPIAEPVKAAAAQPAPAAPVEQPEIVQPVPPAPRAEPAAAQTPPAREAAPKPPAPVRVETWRAPEQPRPLRPLTANEVSLIGPLPVSSRATTILGVRRR
jgi:hypothetical protein